ncbi:MAG: hypothetical protein QW318_09105 [Candidatus Caldarchaeum sp.]
MRPFKTSSRQAMGERISMWRTSTIRLEWMGTSMLVLNLYLQSTASQQAALRQAELAAEEGKKYLRLSAVRGLSNETLINLYGAGKVPITIDYILVQLQNDMILVDRGCNILTVNPGENITLTPSQLDPRLAPYDLDYWKAEREKTVHTTHV